jgi:hypothetical protein
MIFLPKGRPAGALENSVVEFLPKGRPAGALGVVVALVFLPKGRPAGALENAVVVNFYHKIAVLRLWRFVSLF